VEAGEVTNTEARRSTKPGQPVNRLQSLVASVREESEMQTEVLRISAGSGRVKLSAAEHEEHWLRGRTRR
jgi:hypothetical protein